MMLGVILASLIGSPSVVSLDSCADQYVLALAQPDQILALSMESRADYNAMAEAAQGYRQVRRTGEDILALAPDIVVRSYGGDDREVRLFERAGISVYQLGYTIRFDDIRTEITRLSAELDQVEMGQALIDDMNDTLAAAGDLPSGQSVLYVTPGGVTTAADTMMHAIIETAGFTNQAAASGITGWTDLPLEALVLNPPEMIVTSFFNTQANLTDRWSSVHHPVMKDILNETQRVDIPAPLISCSNWFGADAALLLKRSLQSGSDVQP